MMRGGIRIHAGLFGVPRDAYDELSDELEGLDEVEYDGRILRFWHDGAIAEPEELLERLVGRAGLECEGGMDVFDEEEWTVTRYVVEKGKISGRTIPLNEVLEGGAAEWGA